MYNVGIHIYLLVREDVALGLLTAKVQFKKSLVVILKVLEAKAN
jgi:hypothetical protein